MYRALEFERKRPLPYRSSNDNRAPQNGNRLTTSASMNMFQESESAYCQSASTEILENQDTDDRKGIPCAFFRSHRGCRNGAQCPYGHDPFPENEDNEDSNSKPWKRTTHSPPPKTTETSTFAGLCSFYRKDVPDSCWRGDSCRFHHVQTSNDQIAFTITSSTSRQELSSEAGTSSASINSDGTHCFDCSSSDLRPVLLATHQALDTKVSRLYFSCVVTVQTDILCVKSFNHLKLFWFLMYAMKALEIWESSDSASLLNQDLDMFLEQRKIEANILSSSISSRLTPCENRSVFAQEAAAATAVTAVCQVLKVDHIETDSDSQSESDSHENEDEYFFIPP